jgi:DNA-binding NarL/FixJ family response regulator
MAIKIAISCSNRLFGEGLKRLLEDDPDVKVLGIFNGGSGVLPGIGEISGLDPDIILAEFSADHNFLLSLPGEFFNDGRLKILLLGDRSTRLLIDKRLRELIARGLVGILPPSADSELLRKALKAIFSGELWLDRGTLLRFFSSVRNTAKPVSLAKREREIVLHICQGYRNKEIAQKLNISEQTVKSHCNRIYRKLGVSDRLQLALYSYKISLDNTGN